MQKITPFLWFDGNAEEAVNFYVAIFKNSKIGRIARQAEGAGGQQAAATTITFQLEGQDFIALNGGPQFKFTPAISFFVNCQTQDEIDRLWDRLSAGGEPLRCGWLKDKFGVSWQIIPSVLGELLQHKDPEKSQRAMQAMLHDEQNRHRRSAASRW